MYRPEAGDRPVRLIELLDWTAARFQKGTAAPAQKPIEAGASGWDSVVEAAQAHRILPLLISAVHDVAGSLPGTVPPGVRRKLHAIAAANLAMTRELSRIVQLLAGHGIRALPFKGPALAVSLYGTPCLREFSDLDILVAPEDAMRAADILTRDGYRPEIEAGRRFDKTFLRQNCVLEMTRLVDATVVELHWALMPVTNPLPLDFDTLWNDSATVSFGGTAFRTLGVEHLLLLLCVHGAKHCWSSLRWVCDVAELVHARTDINWQRVIELAGSIGCQRMLLLGVLLACDLFRVRIPGAISRYAAEDKRTNELLAKLRSLILAESGLGEIEQFAFSIAVRERWRDRVSMWFHYLRAKARPRARDRQIILLPSFASPVYFLIRAARLVRSYGIGSVVRLLAALKGENMKGSSARVRDSDGLV